MSTEEDIGAIVLAGLIAAGETVLREEGIEEEEEEGRGAEEGCEERAYRVGSDEEEWAAVVVVEGREEEDDETVVVLIGRGRASGDVEGEYVSGDDVLKPSCS